MTHISQLTWHTTTKEIKFPNAVTFESASGKILYISRNHTGPNVSYIGYAIKDEGAYYALGGNVIEAVNFDLLLNGGTALT